MSAGVGFLVARYHYLHALLPQMSTYTGTWTNKSGWQYTGEMRNGLPNGKGHLIFANGAVYDGEVANGKLNGKGRFTDSLGVYEGDFYNNRQCGRGIYHYADGDWYEGEVFNRMFHGHGTYHRHDGLWAEGEFSNGQIFGKVHIHSVKLGEDVDTVLYNIILWTEHQ